MPSISWKLLVESYSAVVQNYLNMTEVNSESNIQVDECRENIFPHLESLERMMKIPVVEAAIVQGQEVYCKVKGGSYGFYLVTT